jgi:predicted nucleotidyltransferase component of viral defense system
MSSKAMSLKGKIKNYAKGNNITAQVVLQNYMFERFLERLSKSEYKNKFVIKGGMLVAAIVGLDTRSTMDLDTTLKNMPLSSEQVLSAVNDVCSINIDDDVKFKTISIEPIRKDDIYGGYCVRIDAIYDTIVTPLSIDFSTGDVITPNPVEYEFTGIFDEDKKINLIGYNIETVIAEKVETILRRSVFNTRPRDFYDVYILTLTQKFDKSLFQEALRATSEHRESQEILTNIPDILKNIANSNDLQNMWIKYQKKFIYAKDITYNQLIKSLENLLTE